MNKQHLYEVMLKQSKQLADCRIACERSLANQRQHREVIEGLIIQLQELHDCKDFDEVCRVKESQPFGQNIGQAVGYWRKPSTNTST